MFSKDSDLSLMKVKFKTEKRELSIGQLTVNIEVVENIDELFNELVSRDDNDPEVKDERIPYWAELWPSSLILAKYLEQHPTLVKGKRVIELGCGLGLSGIVAGMLDAKVVMTDYQQDALDFAEKNWKRNVVFSCETILLDWRYPKSIEQADVLLASDVAYESKFFRPLIKTFKKLLKPGGKIILTEPNRKFAKEFFKCLGESGYQVLSEEKRIKYNGIDNRVHLHVIS